MSLFNINSVRNIYRFGQIQLSTTTSAIAEVGIIPPYQGKRPIVLSLNATGGNASDEIHFYSPSAAGKTTVSSTNDATSTESTVDLVSDGAENSIGGHVATTSDYVILELDGRDRILGNWQIFRIGSLGTGTATIIDINSFDVTASMDQFEDATAFRATASAGNRAYVVDSTEVAQLALGAASINLEMTFVGNPGAPAALAVTSTSSGSTSLAAVYGYVD